MLRTWRPSTAAIALAIRSRRAPLLLIPLRPQPRAGGGANRVRRGLKRLGAHPQLLGGALRLGMAAGLGDWAAFGATLLSLGTSETFLRGVAACGGLSEDAWLAAKGSDAPFGAPEPGPAPNAEAKLDPNSEHKAELRRAEVPADPEVGPDGGLSRSDGLVDDGPEFPVPSHPKLRWGAVGTGYLFVGLRLMARHSARQGDAAEPEFVLLPENPTPSGALVPASPPTAGLLRGTLQWCGTHPELAAVAGAVTLALVGGGSYWVYRNYIDPYTPEELAAWHRLEEVGDDWEEQLGWALGPEQQPLILGAEHEEARVRAMVELTVAKGDQWLAQFRCFHDKLQWPQELPQNPRLPLNTMVARPAVAAMLDAWATEGADWIAETNEIVQQAGIQSIDADSAQEFLLTVAHPQLEWLRDDIAEGTRALFQNSGANHMPDVAALLNPELQLQASGGLGAALRAIAPGAKPKNIIATQRRMMASLERALEYAPTETVVAHRALEGAEKHQLELLQFAADITVNGPQSPNYAEAVTAYESYQTSIRVHQWVDAQPQRPSMQEIGNNWNLHQLPAVR